MKLAARTKTIVILFGLVVLAGLIFAAVNYNKLKEPLDDEASTVEDLQQWENEIVISKPLSGEAVSSPVALSGKAMNNWYFEASFPVQILDADGTVLGSGPLAAQSDWMQPGWVNFAGSLEFKPPKGQTGTLVFTNDNPSGLPDKQKNFRLSIKFK